MSEIVETLSVQEAHERFADLIHRVADRRGRINIPTPAGDVVIMSKVEIEALERAINIMAETAEFRAIAHALHRIAAATIEEPVLV